MISLLNRKKVNKINVINKRHENWTFGAKRLFIYLLIALSYPLQSTANILDNTYECHLTPSLQQPSPAQHEVSTRSNRLRWPGRWQAGILRRWGPRNNNRIDLWRCRCHESPHWARLARWPPCSRHSMKRVAPLPHIISNIDSLLYHGRNK